MEKNHGELHSFSFAHEKIMKRQYFQRIPWHKFLISAIALVCVVYVIGNFYENNLLVAIVLLIPSMILVLRPHRRKHDMIAFFFAAIVGPLMEMLLIKKGVWSYANPTYGGAPLWLPLLWGLSVMFLIKVSRWIAGE